MSTFATVWPVIAFFGGSVSTLLVESLRDARTVKREARARQEVRAQAAVDRRDAFELAHLIDLNKALGDLTRAASRVHLTDTATSKVTGVYAGTQVGDEDSDNLLLANRRVSELRGLVLDDGLRRAVEAAHIAMNVPSSLHKADVDQATNAFTEALMQMDAVQRSIAERIRAIYRQFVAQAE